MNKIRIIDLLNKIANGEEIPQTVSYKGKKYHIDELEHFYVNDDRKALLEYIFDYLNDFDALMTEIEIIEEDKKIEKIKIDDEDRIQALSTGNYVYKVNQPTKNIIYKINELIDKVNSLENKQ